MVAEAPIVPKFGTRVTDVLREMLRPSLIPAPGKQFVVADWSSVEARVNPWLSNCGQSKLDIFTKGEDVYKVNASATFKCAIEDVTADQRQIGKVQELACGFGGGVGAFAAMGRVYGVNLSDAQSQAMVGEWRAANRWAVSFWSDLERAFTDAMYKPDTAFAAGRITYMFDGQHLWYALPSGRLLCYPFAKREADGISYAKSAWKPAQDAKEWPRHRLWKGLACENVTQAVANDLLRHALRQLDGVVLHVHDEIVLECDTNKVERAMRRLDEIMCTPPAWAQGLPLNVECAPMARYGK